MDSKAEKCLKSKEEIHYYLFIRKAHRRILILIANSIMREGPLQAINEEGVILY